MIEMRLSATDLMRVRFAFSPLAELVHALRALRDPASHALHVPFARRASRALGGLDVPVPTRSCARAARTCRTS